MGEIQYCYLGSGKHPYSGNPFRITSGLFCCLPAFKWALKQLPKCLGVSPVQNSCCHIFAEVCVGLFPCLVPLGAVCPCRARQAQGAAAGSQSVPGHRAQAFGLSVCAQHGRCSCEVTTCSGSSIFQNVFKNVFKIFFKITFYTQARGC